MFYYIILFYCFCRKRSLSLSYLSLSYHRGITNLFILTGEAPLFTGDNILVNFPTGEAIDGWISPGHFDRVYHMQEVGQLRERWEGRPPQLGALICHAHISYS